MPLTLAATVEHTLDIKKSRFLGRVETVASRADALAVVDTLRAAHPDAAHVCWALLAGGDSGMSDDGEPSGTAGRPMLEVLRHHDLEGVLATVVRYYGGVKLGAGGLVRAYTDAIAGALVNAVKTERIAMVHVALTLPYADENRVRHWLQQQGFEVVSASHATAVTLTVSLPQAAKEGSVRTLTDLTSGRLHHTDAAG
ncbi:IMPACT family protein [Jeongeupia naejangsanensis]|uniref:YigZ family protein n=1 Tax=Jeongeupia naejangsanensis TaxID=613195 RepID=A0ABS2BSD0_9NEIS|nr:YigZ family protein [Jeongeupia naejangsanensis]MBM3117906.1 YigZ family protein [Jeongeupia naejangsanensis]